MAAGGACPATYPELERREWDGRIVETRAGFATATPSAAQAEIALLPFTDLCCVQALADGDELQIVRRLDLVAIAEELVVFVVAALSCVAFAEVVDELDLADPLDVFEAELVLDPQPQRSPVQDGEAFAVHDESIRAEMFAAGYADVSAGDENWRSLDVPAGNMFSWDEACPPSAVRRTSTGCPRARARARTSPAPGC